jgi:hypothetical protein
LNSSSHSKKIIKILICYLPQRFSASCFLTEPINAADFD